MASINPNNKCFNGKLKIGSFNVRGLRVKRKRRTLFHILKRNKFDIVCLQETFLTKKDLPVIKGEWGSGIHLSEGTHNSKGLITLFNKTINFDNCSCVYQDDRCIVSSIKIDNTIFSVTNFYAPCVSSEKINFFNSINKIISETSVDKCDHLFVLGDFNTVRNKNLDVIAGDPHSATIINHFNTTLNDLLLVDS